MPKCSLSYNYVSFLIRAKVDFLGPTCKSQPTGHLVTLSTWELTTILYRISGQHMPQVTFQLTLNWMIALMLTRNYAFLFQSFERYFISTAQQWLIYYPYMSLSFICLLSVLNSMYHHIFANLNHFITCSTLRSWRRRYFFLVPTYHLPLTDKNAVGFFVSFKVTSPLSLEHSI